jgi:putative endonuclease
MKKIPAFYLLASKKLGIIYAGATSNLVKRVWEHKNDVVAGFTQRYNVHRLVYFEAHDTIAQAIVREKQVKKWRRAWKIALIEKENPEWLDLWENVI